MFVGIFTFLLGYLVGFVICAIFRPKDVVGTLRVDNSDPDGPYLFLEMENDVDVIHGKKYVTLKVKEEDFISRD